MKRQTKFTSGEQEQNPAESQTKQTSAREFSSVEELLRYDAAHTTVPPGIARRLQESTAKLPGPKSTWWRRLIGGTKP